jgi:hypothetical protein
MKPSVKPIIGLFRGFGKHFKTLCKTHFRDLQRVLYAFQKARQMTLLSVAGNIQKADYYESAKYSKLIIV